MKFVPRFRAGAIAALTTVSLPTLALAQTLTVTDITFEGENGLKVTIPTVEATGSNLDEATIRGLFGGGLAAAATTLATLDAESIKIPTLTITTTATVPGSEPMTTTYRDLELAGVTDGVATSATLGGADVVGSTTSVTINEMSTGLLDLGAIAGFYGYAEATDELKPVYSDFVMSGMTFSGPNFACTIGAATASEFRARPLKGTMEELMKWTTEIEAAEEAGSMPPPEAMKAAIGYYVDLLTAFETSPSVIDGLDCNGTDEEGNPVTVTAGPMTIGGFRPAVYPELALDGLRVDVGSDGWMEFGAFTWKETDLGGPIEVLEANLDQLTPLWFEQNWRQLIPALGGFSVEGFGMDVPSDDPGTPRIQATIGLLDVSLADYVNGIPADIASSATDVSVTMPPESRPALAALGIENLNLGYSLAAKWDEPSSTIAVNDLTVAVDQLGGISVSGIVGNAGDALFAADPQTALAAAMSLTVKELTISLDNQGFVPALIAFAALEQNQPPQALHLAFTGMAQAMPLALLGATPDAQGLSGALGAFFQGAPNLTVTLTAVDPNGIGLPELMAAQENPALLRGKVTITAATDGEPVPFVFPDLSGLPPPQEATPVPQTQETEPAAEPMPAPPVAAPMAEPTRADDKAGNKQ
jgi:hypothetical protein